LEEEGMQRSWGKEGEIGGKAGKAWIEEGGGGGDAEEGERRGK
jgi:hypothetical protein